MERESEFWFIYFKKTIDDFEFTVSFDFAISRQNMISYRKKSVK